jgi:cytochrome c oxidase subunit 3
LEVASDPFCLLINSSYQFLFTSNIFFYLISISSLYYWKSIFYSWNYIILSLIFLISILLSYHYWSLNLLRELTKRYELLLFYLFILFLSFIISEALIFISFFWIYFHSSLSSTLSLFPFESFYSPDSLSLTFTNTLLLSNAAISLGNSFLSLETLSSFYIFYILLTLILSIFFLSLQIKEFRLLSFSINDSIYSCIFFFLTGLHFFHLTIGLFLLSLFYWSYTFTYLLNLYYTLRVLEIHLFYNLQLFYWHFLEILWLFIFLVFYFSFLLPPVKVLPEERRV